MERRLVAILAADVVGYSLLMGQDEEDTLATLRDHREVVETAIERFSGRVFGGAGDSVMAEFSSPVQAVRCGLQFQQDIKSRNAELPEGRRMHFRVGINLGDVIVEGENLFGDAVNIADRLQALASPGGICISESVHQQVRKTLPFGAVLVGRRALKNISQPVTVFRVATEPAPRSWLRPHRWQVVNRVTVGTAVAAAAVLALIGAWFVFTPLPSASPEIGAFPEVVRATRHFKVDNPAELDDAEAEIIYDRIIDNMAAAYRRSDNPHARSYRNWRRYNTAPYRSETHGNRYLNNYGNRTARAYSGADGPTALPDGSVLAKDSFEVTDGGDVLTGPLALMEKMSPGFNPEGRDWRYTLILPDGSLFGTTNGEDSDRVEFCMSCHRKAGDEQDHLYFLPESYRAEFLKLDLN